MRNSKTSKTRHARRQRELLKKSKDEMERDPIRATHRAGRRISLAGIRVVGVEDQQRQPAAQNAHKILIDNQFSHDTPKHTHAPETNTHSEDSRDLGAAELVLVLDAGQHLFLGLAFHDGSVELEARHVVVDGLGARRRGALGRRVLGVCTGERHHVLTSAGVGGTVEAAASIACDVARLQVCRERNSSSDVP